MSNSKAALASVDKSLFDVSYKKSTVSKERCNYCYKHLQWAYINLYSVSISSSVTAAKISRIRIFSIIRLKGFTSYVAINQRQRERIKRTTHAD